MKIGIGEFSFLSYMELQLLWHWFYPGVGDMAGTIDQTIKGYKACKRHHMGYVKEFDAAIEKLELEKEKDMPKLQSNDAKQLLKEIDQSNYAKDLINQFIDTHPKFMSTWQLKHRLAFRTLCDQEQLAEFFNNFLKWYTEQISAAAKTRKRPAKKKEYAGVLSERNYT